MGLVELDDVQSLLTCARCGGALSLDAQARSVRCDRRECCFSERGFPWAEGWPVLVDFEHSSVGSDELAVVRAASRAATPGRRWTSDRLPGGLRALIKPPNHAAARNIDRLLSLLPGLSPLILVVGGATVGNGVQDLYQDRRTRVLAFDIRGSETVQFVADAHQIPLADNSVDGVVVQAVLEHVLEPARVVREIHRVLKPNGLVYAETPFLQQVHAGAHDFVRYTSSGHRYLFRAFSEIAAGPVAGPGTQVLWSVDHLVRGLTRSHVAGVVARVAFFWLRYLDRLVGAAFAMDDASAYYFLGRASETELSPDDILAYYRGAQRADS